MDSLSDEEDHLSQLWFPNDNLSTKDQPSVSADSGANPDPSYRMSLGKKAGMAGVDMEQVQKTIMDMSSGSKYAHNEERKAQATEYRVNEMKTKLEGFRRDTNAIRIAEMGANALLHELESSRDLSNTYAHLDMDAFFVAVEIRDDPSLAGKPVAVGGLSMLSTSSYEARKYGVRAAMPGFAAKKLCPDLIIIPGHHEKYGQVSHEVMKIVQDYDMEYFAASLDEAYLNITNYMQTHPELTPDSIVEDLRRRIFETTGLTASAGIGPSRMLSKIASDVNKPNGQYRVPSTREAILAFLHDRPARAIPGIGKVTGHVLSAALGVDTCSDIIAKKTEIFALCSPLSCNFFLTAALGMGGWEHGESERKSISVERTFKDTSDAKSLSDCLHHLCDMLIDRMKGSDVTGGKTITVKMKRDDFQVITRAKTLARVHEWTADKIYATALPLLQGEGQVSLRLLGIRLSGFGDDRNHRTHRPIQSYFSDREPITCPICGIDIVGLSDVNDHVDDCLKPRKKHKSKSRQESLDAFVVPAELLKV